MTDQRFMAIAENVAGLSHCRSVQVGAVIVQDGAVVSTGYNATPPGAIGCASRGYCHPNAFYCTDPNAPPSRAIHAEANAIAAAARREISTQDATLYCTLEPCLSCLKLIVGAGIVRVIYRDPLPRSNPAASEWHKLITLIRTP